MIFREKGKVKNLLSQQIICTFIAMLLFAGCSGQSPEEQAAEAAKGYYERLLEGYPDGFIAGKAVADSLPEDYRQQMTQTVEQYVKDMKARHQGLTSIDVSPNVGRRDTTLGITYAFLLLSFADSTQEEIAVPMVQKDGEWKMR